MKRLGKVFWGVLCMILLFAFSHASAGNICAPNIEVVNAKNKVKFSWNEVEARTRGEEIKYVVYVYKAENKNENPPTEAQFEEYKKKNRLKESSPTIDKYKDISFNDNGLYILGVRAIAFNKKNGAEIKGKSDISWSCYKECTIKPQKVVVTSQ